MRSQPLPWRGHPAKSGGTLSFVIPAEVDLYRKMLRETDFTRQRALMREFEKYVVDTQAHEIFGLWWYRIIRHRSFVKGWKMSPSHFINRSRDDLARSISRGLANRTRHWEEYHGGETSGSGSGTRQRFDVGVS